MPVAHDELDAIDLNLLRVLDAVLAERHITRAGARLGMTQSATSHALARLRHHLRDPLLVRGAGGAMVPTARAQALAPAVNAALATLAAAWRGAAFDPSSTRRSFRLGASDFAELVLLPPLVARIAAIAPGVELFIHPVADDVSATLASGAVDAVLAPVRARDARPLTGGCYHRRLFDETLTCLMRAGHPAARQRLTLERFCRLDHLLIAPRGTAGGFVDDALAALGRTRRVAVAVPHFLVAPAVVAASDLVVTVAARVAAASVVPYRLVVRPPPLALPGFTMDLIWHERTHGEAGHRWLRDQIAAVASAVPAR